MVRRIIHVDMDEFFAAVEKLDQPELRGKPLLIGGDPAGRGVVSTASYEARRFGCRSAMPMAQAVRLCPQAIVLPGRHARYDEISERVFAIFARYTPLVEAASIDEAFLDVTGCEALHGDAPAIAASIKRAVHGEIGITCSVGVAHNKFLAKLASDMDKPDGLTIIDEDRVLEMLDPLPVSRLWGIGPVAASRLAGAGVATVGELRRLPLEAARAVLGGDAGHFLRLAAGEDDRPVTPAHEARQMSQEQTFSADIDDVDTLRGVLLEQVETVARRLRHAGLKARTVTIKLRTGDFTTCTRSLTLSDATSVTCDLWKAAEKLFKRWSRRHFAALRLLGMAASNLMPEDCGQLPLFVEPGQARQARLDRALDALARKFGDEAVHRGAQPAAAPGRRKRPKP